MVLVKYLVSVTCSALMRYVCFDGTRPFFAHSASTTVHFAQVSTCLGLGLLPSSGPYCLPVDMVVLIDLVVLVDVVIVVIVLVVLVVLVVLDVVDPDHPGSLGA